MYRKSIECEIGYFEPQIALAELNFSLLHQKMQGKTVYVEDLPNGCLETLSSPDPTIFIRRLSLLSTILIIQKRRLMKPR